MAFLTQLTNVQASVQSQSIGGYPYNFLVALDVRCPESEVKGTGSMGLRLASIPQSTQFPRL